MNKSYKWIGSNKTKPVLWFFAISLLALGFFIFKYKIGYSPTAKPSVLHSYTVKDKGDDIDPDIAYGQGQWIVVWSSDDDLKGSKKDRNIHLSNSKNGTKWSHPKFLMNNPVLSKGNDFSPSIATDGKNNWAVVWSSTVPEIKAYNMTIQIKDDLDLLIARSEDNGNTWKDLKPLNRNADSDSPGYSGGADKTKAENDWSPRITNNGNYWAVVWTGRSRVINVAGADCPDYMKPTKIHFQYTQNITYVGGSPWFGPYCIGSSETDKEPQITADNKGNWVLAWSSMGNVQNRVLGKDMDILAAYANESLWSVPDPAIKWSFPDNVAAYAEFDKESDGSPVVTSDGKGNWIAVWSSKIQNITVNGKPVKINSDADLLISRSTDKGKTWKDLNFLNSNALSDSGDDLNPHLITNQKGKWVMVWQSNENLGGNIGSDFDILMSKSSDNGKTWTSPQALHDNADSDTGNDTNPRIATDTKKWVVVWQSDEDGGSGKDSDIIFASSIFH